MLTNTALLFTMVDCTQFLTSSDSTWVWVTHNEVQEELIIISAFQYNIWSSSSSSFGLYLYMYMVYSSFYVLLPSQGESERSRSQFKVKLSVRTARHIMSALWSSKLMCCDRMSVEMNGLHEKRAQKICCTAPIRNSLFGSAPLCRVLYSATFSRNCVEESQGCQICVTKPIKTSPNSQTQNMPLPPLKYTHCYALHTIWIS